MKRTFAIVATGVLAGWFAAPTPVAAATFPGYVASWYMNTVNTSTLYDMGCASGTPARITQRRRTLW